VCVVFLCARILQSLLLIFLDIFPNNNIKTLKVKLVFILVVFKIIKNGQKQILFLVALRQFKNKIAQEQISSK